VTFLSGGAAGSMSWLFIYPIDYITTIIQSDDVEKRKYPSVMKAAFMKYKEAGAMTFVKGLGITMLRSFPVNGIGFLTFEAARRRLMNS
jgi:solute carrier family 25 carnitine/acylcarnitine transporter 20/29